MTVPDSSSPPRAFTQGVGTVFQFVGVTLFVISMFVCCGSSLIGKEAATHTSLNNIGWHFSGDPADRPTYSAQRAVTICLPASIFMGLGLSAIGLGLQAQNRAAPRFAVVLTLGAILFWGFHAGFFAVAAGLMGLSILCTLFAILSASLFVLSVGAWREIRRDPPPIGIEILPADYKVPYSHLHEEPPEIRLARELELRRGKLAVQQAELEVLERRLKRHQDGK